ncbi:MAG: alpha/beta fold hydrolase [Actinomycetes bacterium]
MAAVEVIEHGAGDPVVMVHGDVGGAMATWEAQLPLADGHRLRLVNRRGWGASVDTEGEDFAVDARDVADIIDEPVHLVGHSYGGVVSLLAAGLVPDSIRSLTVFEPPAFGLTIDRAGTRDLVDRISAVVASGPTPEDFLPQFVAAVGGDPGRLPSPLPPPLAKAASVQLHGRWPWEAVVPLEELAAAPFPKLVVSGGHHPVFDGVCDVLEARLPARRAVIVGAGHSIPSVGAPVNDLLREFWAAAEG